MRFCRWRQRLGSTEFAKTWATILATALGIGCDGRQTPTAPPSTVGAAPSVPATATASVATTATPSDSNATSPQPPFDRLRCRLLTKRLGSVWSVSLRVHNAGSAPAKLKYFHPLMFALDVTSAKGKLSVHSPAFDFPVQPRSVEVQPGKQVNVSSAMSLRFEPTPPNNLQAPRFDHVIVHQPVAVELRGLRVFSNAPGLVCQGRLEP